MLDDSAASNGAGRILMAVMKKLGRFLSAALPVAIVVAAVLSPSGCRGSEDPGAAAPETGKPAAVPVAPVITTRPSALASDILNDITEATDPDPTPRHATVLPDAAKRSTAARQVRFVRLQYDGSSSWNVNMGPGGDYNMLLAFKKITGLPIPAETEYKAIGDLAKYRRGAAPPFVYVTGKGQMEITSRETKTIRAYCLEEGGMIFADNAGGSFDRSFRAVCRRVFPGRELVVIPDNDPLYSKPFAFPNGPPRFWALGSKSRSCGIRHEGRWIVFYHPGRIGEAWKSASSPDSQVMADRACKLGFNIMNYAYSQYLDKHHPAGVKKPPTSN